MNLTLKITTLTFCFIFFSCLTGTKLDKINEYNKITDGQSIMWPVKHAKYTPDPNEIVICVQEEIEDIEIDILYLYNYINQRWIEILNPIELEESKSLINVEFINIVNIYILDKHKILILLWFGSDDLRENGNNFITLLFDYKSKKILEKKTSSHTKKMDKQSIVKRDFFYYNDGGQYLLERLNEKGVSIRQKEILLDSKVPAADICDGINKETIFYSKRDEKNVLILYNWLQEDIIEKITLPDYFHRYLKGNNVNINLSKTKKYLLFGTFPFGFWIYNIENAVIYELFNTGYNWNWGFGFTQVYFSDWSWEGNKVLLNIVSNMESHMHIEGLYEIDLDRIDELNLKKIE